MPRNQGKASEGRSHGPPFCMSGPARRRPFFEPGWAAMPAPMPYFGLLAFVLLSAFGSPAFAAPSWVQLGPQGPEIRAIAEDGHCPSVEIDGEARQTRARAPADAAFPVTVCRVACRSSRAGEPGGHALPLPHGEPRRRLKKLSRCG